MSLDIEHISGDVFCSVMDKFRAYYKVKDSSFFRESKNNLLKTYLLLKKEDEKHYVFEVARKIVNLKKGLYGYIGSCTCPKYKNYVICPHIGACVLFLMLKTESSEHSPKLSQPSSTPIWERGTCSYLSPTPPK
jgi:hypothetical protein